MSFRFGLREHDSEQRFTGRTWKNSAGTTVGTSGSAPFRVDSQGLVVDSLPANYGLMNQESQTTDSKNQIHAIISYVPGMCCPYHGTFISHTLDQVVLQAV